MEKSLIISNTTPLINFAEIGRMDVLASLFGQIVIPPAVRSELTAKAGLFPLATRVHQSSGVSLIEPKDQLLVTTLNGRIHPGEAECITLAMENPHSLLLLDDLAAREIASSNHLPFVGTLGCLVEAKKLGLLPAVAPLLEDLRIKARFWISSQLAARVLREAGEC